MILILRTKALGAVIALLMTTFILNAGAASAAVVGMVRSKTGNVEVKSLGSTGWSPLRISQPLSTGDTVRCGPGSRLVALLFQSRRLLSVGANSTAAVTANNLTGPSVTAAGNVTGPTTRALDTVGGLIGGYRTDTSRGEGNKPVRIAPNNPGWITDTRPHLRFINANDKAGPAQSWTLTMYDQSDNVVWSTHTSMVDGGAVVFDYPADPDIRPLRVAQPRSVDENGAPGLAPAVYLWQVTPFGATGFPLSNGVSWGFLTVLAPADATQLQTQASTLFGDVGHMEDLQEQANQLALDPTKADDLNGIRAQRDALKPKLMQDPDSYATSLLLLARLYEAYGVLQRAVEITDELQPLMAPDDLADARLAAYETASPYAHVRAGLAIPASTGTQP